DSAFPHSRRPPSFSILSLNRSWNASHDSCEYHQLAIAQMVTTSSSVDSPNCHHRRLPRVGGFSLGEGCGSWSVMTNASLAFKLMGRNRRGRQIDVTWHGG